MTVRFVYLIREGDAHKIGSSADPEFRRAYVAPAGRLVHAFPSAAAFAVETALHHRFAPRRILGRGREWFLLTDDEAALVCRVARADAVEDLPPELRPAPACPPVTAKLGRDLHRLLRLLAADEDKEVGELLDEILRPELTRRHARMIEASQRGQK